MLSVFGIYTPVDCQAPAFGYFYIHSLGKSSLILFCCDYCYLISFILNFPRLLFYINHPTLIQGL